MARRSSKPSTPAATYSFVVDGKPFVIDHPALAEHYRLAARIAATQAHIELTLDAAIWEMSNSSGSSGPAITAQMIGIRPRVQAITTILNWLSQQAEPN